MGIVKRKLGMNVLEAANMRLKNIFASGLKIYCNISGGKDSIVLMSLIYDLLQAGEIDGTNLEVSFIDEEVIYEDVVKTVEQWRKKFMMIGIKFVWYTIEHRNNNCFNALENNENFIPWDRYEEKYWARPKPKFAVSETPYLIPRVESYQQFLARQQADGICLTGVRTSESINRLNYVATVNSIGGVSREGKAYPIYDWKDSDIWKYIKDKNLDFPDVYLRMYEAGCGKNELRVCNLFAIDTCRSLVHLFETYPNLWEQVLRREPNAYLVRLYWDTEMFHRNTKKKRKIEKETGAEKEPDEDYRAKLIEIVNNPTKYFRNPHAIKLCRDYRNTILQESSKLMPYHYKKLYYAILAGDTKGRTLRAVRQSISGDYLRRENVYYGQLEK